MNKLWVFVGGCVTGALGLLAAAAMSDDTSGVPTNADDKAGDTLSENCQEEDGHCAAESNEAAQVRAVE